MEPGLNRVHRHSDQVSLPPHAMDLLVFLARRSGEVVSIEEMIEEVWQGKPMTSGSVYNSLNTLRQAFGDDSRQPQYIENIPKRGYRLIAPVAIPVREANDASPDTAPGAGTLRKSLFLVAVLLLLVALYWTGREFLPVTEDQVTLEKSIAVLPFIDLSPDASQAFYAQGISEEILSKISGYPGLKVVGRTSSFTFQEVDQNRSHIGRQLGVAYLLEGSVRREGLQLKVSAQLVNAEDGSHVWSADYDAEVGQVFNIQDHIAANIASELRINVLGEESPGGSTGIPASELEISAYDLLLLARARVHGGSLSELEEAVEFLQQALEIDPDYAAAHAELAYAWVSLANGHPLQYPVNEWITTDGLIMQHAQKALSLDSGLADAHFAVGSIFQFSGGRSDNIGGIEQAESAYRKALQINPNHARTHLWLSGLMRAKRSSWNERLEPARRAIELEPLWAFPKHFFIELAAPIPELRKEVWALFRQLKASQHGDDHIRQTLFRELLALKNEGRFAEAIQLAERFMNSGNNDVNLPARFGIIGQYLQVLYMIGAYDEVQKWPDRRIGFYELHYPGETEEESAFIKNCILPGESPSSLRYLSCAYHLLLSGNTSQAEHFMKGLLPAEPADIDPFSLMTDGINSNRSPIITLATIHKLNGRPDLALAWAKIEEAILESESESGAIESPVFSRTRARLHALRGETEQAIDELEKTIGWGMISFRMFMHPLFNDLRGHPRYEALKGHWIGLINAERAKLGFEPLELNPDAGPGTLPFLLD